MPGSVIDARHRARHLLTALETTTDLMLFGDRVADGSLLPVSRIAAWPIGHGPGLDWVEQVAGSVRIEIIG